MSQLTQYIIALTHLYGMVHKNKAAEIYNSQNEEPVSLDELEALLSQLPEELDNAFIYTHEDYFVHETILEFDEFDKMLRKKADKPYYIPDKSELLKYVDESYFEKPRQWNALLDYARKNFFRGREDKARWLCEDIHGLYQSGANIQTILNTFNDRGISFRGINQINEVLQLIMDLSNNIRIWENNGHTPNEIFELFEKPHMKPLPDKPFDLAAANVIDMKRGKKSRGN